MEILLYRKVNERYLFNSNKLNVYEPATKNNTSINPNIPPDVLPFTFLYILPNKSDKSKNVFHLIYAINMPL